MMTDYDIVTRILQDEGWDKFTDRADDKGGPTRWGITLPYLSDALGRKATVADLLTVTEKQARDLMYAKCIKGPGFDKIASTDLRWALVDIAYNSGASRAVKCLQEAIHALPIDGVLGPITLAAANALDGRRTAICVTLERIRFLSRWALNDLRDDDHDGKPDNLEMLPGLVNRACAIIRELA